MVQGHCRVSLYLGGVPASTTPFPALGTRSRVSIKDSASSSNTIKSSAADDPG